MLRIRVGKLEVIVVVAVAVVMRAVVALLASIVAASLEQCGTVHALIVQTHVISLIEWV